MTFLLAAIVAAGITLPHCLDLHRAAPAPAAALWLTSVALRALTAVFVVVYVVMFLPSTAMFHALTHWCWETVLPLLTGQGGLEGHRVGDAATAVPGVLLAASLVSVAFGVARTARAARRLIARSSLGRGPHDSVIVGGPEIVLAAAGLARPRVIVTAGALLALEDDELAAGLDHERGHIARRHRYVLVLADLCRSAGRVIPGGRRALREVTFHLERDADRWALSRRNDSHALARAICKSAMARSTTGPVVTALTGAGTSERVEQLIDAPPRAGRAMNGALHLLAVAMVVVTLALAAMVPPAVAAGAEQLGTNAFVPHCEHSGSDAFG